MTDSYQQIIDTEKEVSRRWAPHYDEVFSNLHHERMRDVLAGLVARDPDCRVIVDVGAGPGNVQRAIDRIRPGTTVISVDVSADVLRQGRRRGLRVPVVATAENLPFRADSVDAVVGCHVLHHLHDMPATLARVYSILKPGGLLAFVEPVECELLERKWFRRPLRALAIPAIRALRRKYRDKLEIRRRHDLQLRSTVHKHIDDSDVERALAGLSGFRLETRRKRHLLSEWVGEHMYGDAAWEQPMYGLYRLFDEALATVHPALGLELVLSGRKAG